MENFRVSKVVIIDSLEDEEFQTGSLLESTMRHDFAEYALPLSVERYSITWSGEFEPLINYLASNVANGYPIVHIEMHGDIDDGLIFKNGSNLSWEDVTRILARLNHATRFNLVCVFAACFGAYFTKGFWVNQASPCLAIIAPEEELGPEDVYRGYSTLYRNLAVSRDMGKAADLLNETCPISGGWFQARADIWFLEVLSGYVKQEANAEAVSLRANAYLTTLTSSGVRQATWSDAEMIVLLITHEHVSHLAFEKFFMTADFPENIERFAAVKKRLKEELLPLIRR